MSLMVIFTILGMKAHAFGVSFISFEIGLEESKSRNRILILTLEIKMCLYMPFQSLAPALVAIASLLSLIHSLKSNPASAIKDVPVVLSLHLAGIFDKIGWLRAFSVLLPLSLLITAIMLFSWASAVAYVQRKLILWCQDDPEQEKCLLGKPLFFPSQLTHARIFPEKYHYGIDYFLVGIPVGLRGRVGALMSVDSDGSDPRSPTFNSFQSSLKRLFRKCVWFSIDTSQYLHRGDGHMSLTQKLEHFLTERVCTSQNQKTRVSIILTFPGRGC